MVVVVLRGGLVVGQVVLVIVQPIFYCSFVNCYLLFVIFLIIAGSVH